MDLTLHIEDHESPQQCEEILFSGINQNAVEIKEMIPIRSFCISLKNNQEEIVGGVNGVTYYGCLYLDMLFVAKEFRSQGWGAKLVAAAEKIGKERGCSFSTVNTMDWEALPFYKKLGYFVEFTREGYEKSSKMFMLRKDFTA